jgi:hypothetical protein
MVKSLSSQSLTNNIRRKRKSKRKNENRRSWMRRSISLFKVA